MRTDFESRLQSLEDDLIAVAQTVDEMLADAVGALVARDADAAERTAARDSIVDRTHAAVQNGVLRVIALHAPVSGDLRRISAMLHVSVHLERMGDHATTVARFAGRSAQLAQQQHITDQIVEMATLAREVGRHAVGSFRNRDADAAAATPALDDRVDVLNLAITERLLELVAADPASLPWAREVLLAPRIIERYADHAVDIAEQTIFVVTGETVEFSSNAA